MLINDDKKLDAVLERFYNRYNKYNTDVLKTLGNVVKQFDGLTPSQAHQLAQELRIGYDVYKLQEELAKISGKSVEEVDKLLEKVAKENVEFSEVYYNAKNKEYVDYENNSQLQNLVESIKKETNNTFVNISKSQNTGFSLKQSDGSYTYKTIPQVYNDLIDEAVYNVSIGMVDYQSAMRNTLNQLADSGVKVHEEKVTYPSGYNRRIDSSVRMNILTGLRQINIGTQQEIGEDLDADGIEVSFHVPCADDHWEINGRQYKARENETLDGLLDRINNNLDRPIGTLNCTHFVFSIIYGVQEPNYSKEYIDKQRELSKQTKEYNGKKYTPYQATQVQRRLETEIRKQKDRQIISKSSGDKEGILKAQSKITQLTKEYNNFSRSMGLKTYKNRLTVSGYRRVGVSNIVSNVKYKILGENDITKLDNMTKNLMNDLTKEEINSISSYVGIGHDEINKTMKYGKPDEHIIYNNTTEIKEDIRNISKAMNKSSLKENITAFRGVYEDFTGYKIGDTFNLDSYVSTSVNEKIGLYFAKRQGDGGSLLEIRTPKGTNAIYIGDNFSSQDEKELLLDDGLKYKLIDIKEIVDNNYGNYKKYIIEVVK